MTPERPATPAGGHVAALDGVRGLAILLVLFVHFVGDATPVSAAERAAVKLANYGVWGVDLFFVLSGFLITGILLRSRGKPAFFRTFYARRTLRIFPLYYGVLALLFLVLPALIPGRLYPAGLAESRAHAGWLVGYMTNLYLAIQGGWALPYVGHFWSLAVEEHFYLFWPLCVAFLSLDALAALSLGLVVLAVALRIVLSTSGFGAIPVLVLTPCRLDALAIGGLLAIGQARSGTARIVGWARRSLAPFALLTLGLSAWNLLAPSCASFVVPLRGLSLALLFGALVGATVGASPRSPLGWVFRLRGLRALGTYSYGLYVFHGIVAYAMFDHGVDRSLAAALGSHAGGVVAFAALGATASLAIAAASYQLFEEPFLRLKDRFTPGAARRCAVRASSAPS